MDFNGGTLRNAIPREAFATVAVPAAKAEELKNLSSLYLDILKNELSEKEKNLTVVLESVTTDKAALTAQSRDTFVQLLNATPNGVIRNSDVAKGVVETSLNVGVVTMGDDSAEIICLIRSLIDSGKEYVVSMLKSLGTSAGAKTSAKGSYPAGSRMQVLRSWHWCVKLIRDCSTAPRTFRLFTRVWNVVCSRNRIRIWTWSPSGRPSRGHTPRMSRFTLKASVTTGRC